MCDRCDSPAGVKTLANQACMPINGRMQCIDWCIHPIVAALNAAGLTTVASCCGHGKVQGRIDLADGRVLFLGPPASSYKGWTFEPADPAKDTPGSVTRFWGKVRDADGRFISAIGENDAYAILNAAPQVPGDREAPGNVRPISSSPADAAAGVNLGDAPAGFAPFDTKLRQVNGHFCCHPWRGPGPEPKYWWCCGVKVYRSYGDYVDD